MNRQLADWLSHELIILYDQLYKLRSCNGADSFTRDQLRQYEGRIDEALLIIGAMGYRPEWSEKHSKYIFVEP